MYSTGKYDSIVKEHKNSKFNCQAGSRILVGRPDFITPLSASFDTKKCLSRSA